MQGHGDGGAHPIPPLVAFGFRSKHTSVSFFTFCFLSSSSFKANYFGGSRSRFNLGPRKFDSDPAMGPWVKCILSHVGCPLTTPTSPYLGRDAECPSFTHTPHGWVGVRPSGPQIRSGSGMQLPLLFSKDLYET